MQKQVITGTRIIGSQTCRSIERATLMAIVAQCMDKLTEDINAQPDVEWDDDTEVMFTIRIDASRATKGDPE